MSSVNKVILVGNLGQDPEVRIMQNGDEMVTLSIATSESWKDKNSGERRKKTEWHRVVIFNKGIVRVAKNYLSKGSKVYIEGQLETRKWQDKQGNDKYSTEVVLRPYKGELTMLDSRNSQSPENKDLGGEYRRQKDGNPFDGGGLNDLDDDIPF